MHGAAPSPRLSVLRTFGQTATDVYVRAANHLKQRNIGIANLLFSRAEELGFDPDECSSGRWVCAMLAGQFEDAWQECERIAQRGRPDPHSLWDGAPLTGKKVMLRCLHGYGDTVQFIRYAPMVRQLAASLVVETHPEMVSLVRCASGVNTVTSWTDKSNEALTGWNQQIEIMELARVFRTTAQNIPQRVPYLFPERWRVERSREHIKADRRAKIGLVWSASDYNRARNIALGALRPIIATSGATFYSLQHGKGRLEAPELFNGQNLIDTAEYSTEIADTAGFIVNLDLVITVDTLTAHLAGALGKPVWTLIPFEGDWRWMLDRDDSPWYPTMRLFRQPKNRQWNSVIAKVAEELRGFVNTTR
jgi:hypothetical protein